MRETEVNRWLKDHIEYFEELLGLDLNRIEGEVVKGGTPDIIAENGENLVVFENQLERADKKHLGQILYYLYNNKKIKTGVLIAPSFSDNFLFVFKNIEEEISKNLLGVKMMIKRSPRRLFLKKINGKKREIEKRISISGLRRYCWDGRKTDRTAWESFVNSYELWDR